MEQKRLVRLLTLLFLSHNLMKKKIFYIIPLLFFSCTKPIDIEEFLEKKVVVNCILTEQSTQTLSLNYSGSLKDKSYQEIDQARITLLENKKIVGNFQKKGYSLWEISFTPKQGNTYDLEIQIPNTPLITATTKMPKKITINKVKKEDTHTKKNFVKESDDFFWVFAFQKNKDTLMRKITIDSKYKLLQEISTNYSKVDNFNTKEPTSSVFGYKPHFVYLRMKPNENEKTFFLEGNFYSSIIVFRSVSIEYDKYLKSSIQKMLVYQSFEDPTQWLDESEIYTNIKNGVGIFGAYVDHCLNYNIYLSDE